MAVENADLTEDSRFKNWSGSSQEIQEPFEQTVDPSQLNFDFVPFDPKKGAEDEEGCSECSETSSESYGEIDDNVMVEMHNLENIIQNIGLNFRMIDRIGEGVNNNSSFIDRKLILPLNRNLFHGV
jgi:hypothetical protein